jgi:eukaryotic-like serine/threonine-protein kinase
MTEETLFHEALAKADPQERAAFLDQACAGQPELRAAVEGLLAAHAASGHPLDQPVAAQAAPSAEHSGATQQGQTALHVPSDVSPGAVVAGRYTLVEKIGEGGMGEVWVAKQTEPVKRKVALKLVKPGMDSRAVLQRFEQERQALALMDHPHIAKVFDAGLTSDRRPFFAMELVNGLPLTKYCDQVKLGIRERLEIFVPICQAVQHAHQKGVVHRDLKPSNILVTLIDAKPIPKIIDFGVAKAIGGKLTDETLSTHFGAVIGTLEYMAPEQAGFSAADVDTRADIYSLGVILYELLTGLRPFDRRRLRKAAVDEMIRMIREEEPSKPSTRISTDESSPSLAAVRQMEPRRLAKLLRGELDWVVLKCLEKQRDRRYETASGLARDIERYLANEPVEARSPSAGYRLRKFVRRNRGPVAAATLLLVFLLAGIAGTTWGLIRADQSRRSAVEARDAETEQREAAESSEKETRAANAQLRDARDELRTNLYAARSNLIQAAWEAHGVTRMRELLEEQKPRPGERDLRGFEWHYWDRRANAELSVGPPASPYEKARVNWRILSPDGRRHAVVWGSRTNEQHDQSISKIEVRDALSGAAVSSFDLSIPIAGRQSPFTYPWLAFTADSEGLFASWIPYLESKGGAATTIHWWLFDAISGKQLVSHHEAPCEPMHPHLLAPDRNLVAVPSRVTEPKKGVQLRLLSAATGKEARTCEGTFEAIHETAFRADGKEVAAIVSPTATGDTVVKVWDTATGGERWSRPAGIGYVSGVAWSPDGRRLAIASPALRIWDITDGRQVLAMTGPDGMFGRVVFSPTGDRMASVDPSAPNRFVTLRDSATGQTRAKFLVPEELLWGVAFSADGTRLVTLARFGTVRTWDAMASDLPVEVPARIELPPLPADALLRNAEYMWNTSLSADGSRFAVAGGSKSQGKAFLHVWDQTGRSVFTSSRATPPDTRILIQPAHLVALSPDGRRVAWVYGTAWGANTEPERVGVHLTVIDLTSGKELWSQELHSVNSRIEFSPDGEWLAAHIRPRGAEKNAPTVGVKIIEVLSGREVHAFPIEGCGDLHYSADGSRLVGRSSSLKVWDLRTGTEIPGGRYPPDLIESPGMADTALSPDGTLLAVSWRGYDTGDGKVRIFEVPSCRELRSLKGIDAIVSAVAFSSDGTRLAAAGRTIKIWDVASGQELITLRDPPQAFGGILRFSSDGHRLRTIAWRGEKLVTTTWDATPRGVK